MMRTKQTRSALLLIVLLGILARTAWLGYSRPEPVNDYWDYLQVASRMVEHRGYVTGRGRPTALWLPGTPFFLAGLMLVSSRLYWLSLAMAVVSGLLAVPVYFLARNVSGGRAAAGLRAAGLAALYPPFVFYSPVLASEHLEALLAVSALALLSGPAGSILKRVLPAGALLAGAVLSRGSALAYLPAATFSLLWEPGFPLRRRLLRLGIFLAAAGLPLGGWWTRNRVLIGPGVGLASISGVGFYLAHNPGGFAGRMVRPGYPAEAMAPIWAIRDEAERSREGYRRGLEHIRRNPGPYFSQVLVSTRLLYNTPEYAWFFATRTGQKDGRGPSETKPLKMLSAAGVLTAWSHVLLLSLAVLSVLFWKKIPRRGLALILLALFGHWFFYAAVYYGAERYGYMAAVLALPLASLIPGLAPEISSGRAKKIG